MTVTLCSINRPAASAQAPLPGTLQQRSRSWRFPDVSFERPNFPFAPMLAERLRVERCGAAKGVDTYKMSVAPDGIHTCDLLYKSLIANPLNRAARRKSPPIIGLSLKEYISNIFVWYNIMIEVRALFMENLVEPLQCRIV